MLSLNLPPFRQPQSTSDGNPQGVRASSPEQAEAYGAGMAAGFPYGAIAGTIAGASAALATAGLPDATFLSLSRVTLYFWISTTAFGLACAPAEWSGGWWLGAWKGAALTFLAVGYVGSTVLR